MTQLYSIRTAAAAGINVLRLPKWANKLDYLRIDIINGKPGPWVHLYSPINKSVNGRNPVDVLAMEPQINVDVVGFEAYTGPLHDSEEWKNNEREAHLDPAT